MKNKKIYTGIAATCNKVFENWGGTSEFSKEALESIAQYAIDKPISINFDANNIVGYVNSARVENDELILEFEVNNEIDNSFRICPEFYACKDEWKENDKLITRIIKNARPIGFGLTLNPAEKELPPIKRKD